MAVNVLSLVVKLEENEDQLRSWERGRQQRHMLQTYVNTAINNSAAIVVA